jgi:hypothetical protein
MKVLIIDDGPECSDGFVTSRSGRTLLKQLVTEQLVPRSRKCYLVHIFGTSKYERSRYREDKRTYLNQNGGDCDYICVFDEPADFTDPMITIIAAKVTKECDAEKLWNLILGYRTDASCCLVLVAQAPFFLANFENKNVCRTFAAHFSFWWIDHRLTVAVKGGEICRHLSDIQADMAENIDFVLTSSVPRVQMYAEKGGLGRIPFVPKPADTQEAIDKLVAEIKLRKGDVRARLKGLFPTDGVRPDATSICIFHFPGEDNVHAPCERHRDRTYLNCVLPEWNRHRNRLEEFIGKMDDEVRKSGDIAYLTKLLSQVPANPAPMQLSSLGDNEHTEVLHDSTTDQVNVLRGALAKRVSSHKAEDLPLKHMFRVNLRGVVRQENSGGQKDLEIDGEANVDVLVFRPFLHKVFLLLTSPDFRPKIFIKFKQLSGPFVILSFAYDDEQKWVGRGTDLRMSWAMMSRYARVIIKDPGPINSCVRSVYELGSSREALSQEPILRLLESAYDTEVEIPAPTSRQAIFVFDRVFVH